MKEIKTLKVQLDFDMEILDKSLEILVYSTKNI